MLAGRAKGCSGKGNHADDADPAVVVMDRRLVLRVTAVALDRAEEARDSITASLLTLLKGKPAFLSSIATVRQVTPERSQLKQPYYSRFVVRHCGKSVASEMSVFVKAYSHFACGIEWSALMGDAES